MRRFHAVLISILLAVPLAGGAADDGKVELTDDTVLFERGDVAVTLADFEALLRDVPEEHRQGVADDPERMAQLLDSIAKNRLLAEKAEKTDLAADADVRARLRLTEERILAQALLARASETADKPDFEQQAREYYLTHRDEFKIPEQVTVSHVLVNTEDRSEDAARARAEKVMALARSGERKFESLVKEFSDDPSAEQNNGRLERLTPGKTAQAFDRAAFALEQPGDLAGPIQTSFGFHVIRLEERYEERQKSFAEVRDQLVAKMKNLHEERARSEYLNRILEQNPVEADPEVIKALRERYRHNIDKVTGSAAGH